MNIILIIVAIVPGLCALIGALVGAVIGSALLIFGIWLILTILKDTITGKEQWDIKWKPFKITMKRKKIN